MSGAVPDHTPERASAGELIRWAREEITATQAALAEIVGVGVPYISKIENGREHASEEVLTKIATALQLDTDELMLADGKCPAWMVKRLRAGGRTIPAGHIVIDPADIPDGLPELLMEAAPWLTARGGVLVAEACRTAAELLTPP